MIALTELLERKYPTGAYLVRSHMTYQAVKQIVEQASFNLLYIDGQKINTVEEFFAESSSALKFPNYHGDNWTNWDAFADFLKDLENRPPAKGDVIMYDEFQHFAHNDPERFFIAFRHLESVAQETNSSYPLYVLLRASGASTTDNVLSHLSLITTIRSETGTRPE